MTGLTADCQEAPRARPSVVQGLLSLLAPQRRQVVMVGLLVLVAAALELVPPLIIRAIVDHHLTVRDSVGVPALALLYLLAVGAMQAVTFLYGYLAATGAQGALRDLRTRLFGHLQRLPTSYFDRRPLGDVISRCTSDVDTLDTVFSSGVALLMANLVRLVTIAVAMVALSPMLSFIAAAIAAPVLLVTRRLQVRVRQAERENRVAVGAIHTRLQEDLRSIEVIRAFGREPEFVAGFRQVLGRALAATNRSMFYSALYTPTTAMLSAVAVMALLTAGTQPALGATSVSLGTLTAFLLLLQRFFQPITALGEEWQTVQGALAGAERILDTLALPPDEVPVPARAPPAPDRSAWSVVLSNVEFGYAEGHPVLRGLSLQVRPGEHVALVGRTGAGKTSALHLLAGLYRPWAGTVAVGGRDPARLGESERPRMLGVVPQVVQLFSGTVFDNLALGETSVAEEAVYEAAAVAGADSFIRALPHGYLTPLSGTGSGTGAHLSAGQQQLLALARALVHRPAVLLLDEATAAIDNTSDAAFRAALRERVLRRGCAVVAVAHRLTTALEADRVIVLDRGRIVEEGAPAALIAGKGRFAALLELEAAGWDWRSSA
jgi:ATP-binding cassette, subfamily B, multidrug efflux pump